MATCRDCDGPINTEVEGYYEDQVGTLWCKPCGHRRFQSSRAHPPPCCIRQASGSLNG